MCGIVGAIAQRDVTPILLEGLKHLEYRGYDSAGLAVFDSDHILQNSKVKGKVQDLANAVAQTNIHGFTGIAHTRWATHGVPSEINAHPHFSGDDIALVHNGIIENFEALRDELAQLGYHCVSETDSEVITHLFSHYAKQETDLQKALQLTVARLEGAYAIGVIHQREPGTLLGVRKGSPLVVGLGLGENYLASDSLALLPVTQRFIYLEEGDIVKITQQNIAITNAQGNSVQRQVHQSQNQHTIADKGEYQHFMLKEIFEQPQAIANTLEGRLSDGKVLTQAFGHHAPELFAQVQRVVIIACGTSYHAGLVAKYWLEQYAKVSCTVEVASEYRYRSTVTVAHSLFVTISQSGETADTLAALRLAKQQDYLASLAICNVPESSLVRESDLVFMTRAGIEIGVASTKAFVTQLTGLLLLTTALGKARKQIAPTLEAQFVSQLRSLPLLIEQSLSTQSSIKELASLFSNKSHSLFLGRGSQFPVALEGALKLKEISYIHAEAYPAGELKHGPLALVDENMPVISIVPNNDLSEKLKSNLHEVQARGGQLILFVAEGAVLNHQSTDHLVTLPDVPESIAPIIYTIPLQLLAYYVALVKGTNVDQPRNLAKSVTVE